MVGNSNSSLLPSPLLIPDGGRLYRYLHRRISSALALRSKDILSCSSSLGAVQVSGFAFLWQNWLAKLCSCFSSTRAIPGRRTLISEFSLAGKATGEVKHITPGWDKGWVDKHKGIVTVLFSGCVASTHGDSGYRAQDAWLGCHKQRTSFMTLHLVPTCRNHGRPLCSGCFVADSQGGSYRGRRPRD